MIVIPIQCLNLNYPAVFRLSLLVLPALVGWAPGLSGQKIHQSEPLTLPAASVPYSAAESDGQLYYYTNVPLAQSTDNEPHLSRVPPIWAKGEETITVPLELNHDGQPLAFEALVVLDNRLFVLGTRRTRVSNNVHLYVQEHDAVTLERTVRPWLIDMIKGASVREDRFWRLAVSPDRRRAAIVRQDRQSATKLGVYAKIFDRNFEPVDHHRTYFTPVANQGARSVLDPVLLDDNRVVVPVVETLGPASATVPPPSRAYLLTFTPDQQPALRHLLNKKGYSPGYPRVLIEHDGSIVVAGHFRRDALSGKTAGFYRKRFAGSDLSVTDEAMLHLGASPDGRNLTTADRSFGSELPGALTQNLSLEKLIADGRGGHFLVASRCYFTQQDDRPVGYRQYNRRHLVVSHLAADGTTNWIRVISRHTSLYDTDNNKLGFAATARDGQLHLLINDHPKNRRRPAHRARLLTDAGPRCSRLITIAASGEVRKRTIHKRIRKGGEFFPQRAILAATDGYLRALYRAETGQAVVLSVPLQEQDRRLAQTKTARRR